MGWFCDSTWGNPEGCMRYTPFPQRLQPLWLPCATIQLVRSPLDAQRRPNGVLGRSKMMHRTIRPRTSPWTPWSPWSLEIIQNSPTKVAEEVGCSQVAQTRQGEAHVSPLSQKGCRFVDQYSPRKICVLCIFWPNNSVRWSINVSTTATHELPWQRLCLYYGSFERPVRPLQMFWWFKEVTKVVLYFQQLLQLGSALHIIQHCNRGIFFSIYILLFPLIYFAGTYFDPKTRYLVQ